jgi:hypothetical protein
VEQIEQASFRATRAKEFKEYEEFKKTERSQEPEGGKLKRVLGKAHLDKVSLIPTFDLFIDHFEKTAVSVPVHVRPRLR